MKNIGIIIQARSGSTRLPNKIFLPLPYNTTSTVLSNVVMRARKAVDNIIIATTENDEDIKVVTTADKLNSKIFRGSTHDVMSRYLDTAKYYQLDIIVRITSDCPCIDPSIIQNCINILIDNKADYVSNVLTRSFPHGLDTEVFTIDALIRSSNEESNPKIREHVTLAIFNSENYKKINYLMPDLKPSTDIRVTIDTYDDYISLLILFDELGEHFDYKDIINLYIKKPYLKNINSHVYQKKAFTNISSELTEAKILLKLHDMNTAVKILEENS